MTPQQDLPSSVMREKYFEMMISDRLECMYIQLFLCRKVFTLNLVLQIYTAPLLLIGFCYKCIHTYLPIYTYVQCCICKPTLNS